MAAQRRDGQRIQKWPGKDMGSEATKFAGNSAFQGSPTQKSSRRALETERAVEKL